MIFAVIRVAKGQYIFAAQKKPVIDTINCNLNGLAKKLEVRDEFTMIGMPNFV